MPRTIMLPSITMTCFLLLVPRLHAEEPLQKKSPEAIQQEIALEVSAIITETTTTLDAKTRQKTQTTTIKVHSVKAKQAMFGAFLRKGQLVQFSKTCIKDNRNTPGANRRSHRSRACGSLWAAIPAALQKPKGSRIDLQLRILRSASRIVLATISRTIPETGVIKGTVVLVQ